MSAPQPTYYEVLGVAPSATREEIRRRFRELARRHHPDVSNSPESAVRFREINEANQVLSDPSARANYDAELKLKARLQQPQRPSTAPSSPPPTNPKSSTGQSPGSGSRAQGPASREERERLRRFTEAGALLEEAHRMLARRRFREADDLVRRSIELNGRSSAAYELRGDIYRKRSREDDALAMYSYAVQLDRNNRSAQLKLDRIIGRPSGATMAGSAARASRPASETKSAPTRAMNAGAALTPVRMFVALGSAVLFLSTLYFVSSMRHPAATGPLFFEWDFRLVIGLACSGFAGGLTAALNGWFEQASRVLGLDSRRPGVGLGAALSAVAVIFFHAAALLYLLIATLRGGFSRSILGSLLIAYGLTTAFAFAADTGRAYVLLFGGNLTYSSLVAGWIVAERLKD